eukprot:jgi/Astpho2/8140/fgenesh1_pm.00120_%23_27_t
MAVHVDKPWTRAQLSTCRRLCLQTSLPGSLRRRVTLLCIRAELTAAFQLALGKAFPTAQAQAIVTPTAERDAKFGDYQCNNAMALFGKLKGQPGAPSNPRAAAEALVQALPSTSMLDGTPSLAGPGFINLKVTQDFLGQRITDMLKDGIATWAPRLTRQRVIVDFSSPNVAKEMHVGHLRSTIIGDTIARTLEFCGADVLRLNHIGDWGTQFGMLIEHLNETRSGGLADPSIADMSIAELQSTYKAAKAHFDEDAGFKDRARRGVTKLQGGDPEYLAAWERICEASRKAFSAIYARLGVTLQERGESFYNPRLREAVEELQAMGVAEESEGAVVVWTKPGQPPLMVRKSDGGFGYATTDMAAIKQRLHDEKGDWVIYVTDAGQAEHFASVFAAARKAGYLGDPADPATPWVSHVGFGTVQGEDGKKFKTRSGETVRLVELLDEARDRCLATIKERRGDDIQQEELEHSAAAMGYGAVKYADLRNNRTTNYRFSFDAMLELQGNTAVYLLYAHARIAAIGRKAGIEDIAALAQDHTVHIEHEKERALALHVVRFPEALENALDELMPNRLTEYLYDLSDKFTGFYTECKVVGNEQQTSRLLLCEATAVVMRQCFSLLGITPLYRI